MSPHAFRNRFHYSISDINVMSSIGTAALYISYLAIGPIWDKCGVIFTMVRNIVTIFKQFLFVSCYTCGVCLGHVGFDVWIGILGNLFCILGHLFRTF